MNAIEQAIEQLIGEIALRQDAVRTLQKLLPFGGPAPMTAQSLQAAKLETKPARSATAPERKLKKQMSGLQEKVLAAAARCTEPFSYADVSREVGGGVLDEQVRCCMAHAAKTGKLNLVEKGRGRRPARFALPKGKRASNGASGNGGPAVVRIPGLDSNPKSLEDRLEEAIKERDQAANAGRETLAKILTDKVNDLQHRLELQK